MLILIAFVAGSFNALESGTNTVLRRGLNAPIWSVAAISLMTFVCAVATAVMARERFPSATAIHSIPWWGWSGGLLGFGFVLAMVVTAETLGGALFIGLTVTASTAGSVLLDHFGLIGFSQHPASILRILGAVMMVFGVALVAIF